MGRAQYWAVTLVAVSLTLLGALACGGSNQTSSESHWVVCETSATCQALDSTATCVAGYCEAQDGTRLVQAVTAGGSGAAGEAGSSATVGGAASMGGASGAGNGVGGGSGATSCDAIPAPLPTAQVFENDYLINNADDVAAAQGLTEIMGSLSLAPRGSDGLADIALPALEVLGGDLVIQSSAVVSLELPNLREIGGNLVLRTNSRLEQGDLRQLERVMGSVTIAGNAALERLRVDSLTSVGSLNVAVSVVPSCEIDALLTRLSLPTGGGGRADCQCSQVCGWLEATCP